MAVVKAGEAVRSARKRRRLTQTTLAERVGIRRSRLSEIEAGAGGGASAEIWFALGQALGLYFRFEFGRDPQAEVADAGHLAMQNLVIRVAKAAGWEVGFEAESRSWGVGRSIDVRLIDRRAHRIVIVECWNTFGNVGEAARSSNAKVALARQEAAAIAGDDEPFAVGLVWVVRDTNANRELVERYAHIVEARLPGSSAGWAAVLRSTRARMPGSAGLVWCDLKATRLLARRRGRGAR